MTSFRDPESGRPYEVGPDGVPRWLDDAATSGRGGRPWYRRVRYAAPAAAVVGFTVAAVGNGSPSAVSSAAPSTAPTAIVTTTATVTTQPTSAPAATVTQTVTPARRTVRVTVTRTATAQALAGGGGGGGADAGGGAVYYANCSAARAAGAAPLYVDDPGYRPGLDRDSDGVACE